LRERDRAEARAEREVRDDRDPAPAPARAQPIYRQAGPRMPRRATDRNTSHRDAKRVPPEANPDRSPRRGARLLEERPHRISDQVRQVSVFRGWGPERPHDRLLGLGGAPTNAIAARALQVGTRPESAQGLTCLWSEASALTSTSLL
jgi:hypothetical protein